MCDDAGVISNCEDSVFDPRRRQLTVAGAANEIVIPNEVTATLRDLQSAGRRLRTTLSSASAPTTTPPSWLPADGDLDELIGSVAAEANHEPNRRRQQRLGAAFDALSDAPADGR